MITLALYLAPWRHNNVGSNFLLCHVWKGIILSTDGGVGVGLILFLFSGVVFCWGTFVSGSYLPTATTWLYGSYHLATAHIPLVIGLAASLNARADIRPHSQARSIRNNARNGLMLLIVLKQLWLGRLYIISRTNFLLNSLSFSSEKQSGALSLVGRLEILLSLVESFRELKYFHDVATPALLCHKEPSRRIRSFGTQNTGKS